MTNTHSLSCRARCLLLTLALLAPLTAGASQGYMDYFFRNPPIAGSGLDADFNQILSDVDVRNYVKADEVMDVLQAKLDDGKLSAEARAQLLADAGILKARTGQEGKALPLLRQSTTVIEQSIQRFSPLLYKPLMVEAIIQSKANNYPVAVDLLRQAQHVLHLQDGVYTRKQVPVLDQLTSLDRARGLLLDADLEQRFDLRIAERAYGANSESLIPTLEKLGAYFRNRGNGLPLFIVDSDANAQWLKDKVPPRFIHGGSSASFNEPGDPAFSAYNVPSDPAFGNQIRYFRASLFDESVELYDRAIKILEDKYGPNDLRLVRPLRGLSRARLLEGGHKNLAKQAMERATKIVETNPSTDVEDHVVALVRLGDLYTITEDARAHDVYVKAWLLLDRHPDLKKLEEQVFGEPTRIFPRVSSFLLDRQPMEATEGEALYTTLTFTVDTDGAVKDARATDGNIPLTNRNSVVRYFQKYVKYRPRIVKGQIVETKGVVFRQPFVVNTPTASKRSETASQPEKKSANNS